MDLIARALELVNGDEEDREMAVVYAQLAIAGQLGSIAGQLGSIAGQLESIDDALRNTIGGNPR